MAIFEVLSDDTATTDRVEKLLEYATLPSLRCYVLLEQTAVAATLFHRESGSVWIASAHTGCHTRRRHSACCRRFHNAGVPDYSGYNDGR